MGRLSINQDVTISEIRTEYRSLKWRAEKKIDSFESLLWIVHSILSVGVIVLVALRTHDLGQTFLAAVIYGYIPGLFASMIVTGLLHLAIGKRFGHYLENRRLESSWYQRYQYLKDYIPAYDEAEKLRLAEEKRVRLQPVRNAVQQIRDNVEKANEVIRTAENILWRKRKWYREYREYEKGIEGCIPGLEELEREGQLARAKFGPLAEEASYEFYNLFRKISDSEQRCRSLLLKIQGMKDWTPPVRTYAPRNAVSESGNSVPRPSRNPSIGNTPQSPTPSIIPNTSHISEIKEPVVVLPPEPPKRRVLNRELKKIPFEDYVGAAKAKMSIGELGEVVALHYEIRRVESETGFSSVGKVTRVSEQTDSAGYDIESFSQGDKVFIEVKSTSGGFWTDFFLTANEERVMKNLGEKYWLYRIFELSKDDSSAKLSIFRGTAEIDASFELEAANYKFNPKSNVNGTLPFERLD